MNLRSKTIHFRPVEVADAPFILGLRLDERYNRYLSAVEPDVAKQEQWLAEYKLREALGQEFYYIIQRNADLVPIGTVRIYDFVKDENSFCWGSWILNDHKTRYSALECALLIYDFAFLELGYTRCHMDIRKRNDRVIAFHQRFGVKIVGETELDLLGHYFVEDYLKIRGDILRVIEGG